MDFIRTFFGILLTIAGFVFTYGKGHIHLFEWKNMPQEEKDKIKIIPPYRNTGEVIALNGTVLLVKGLWSGSPDHWFVCAMITWLIIAGFDVWYIEKSNRHRRP